MRTLVNTAYNTTIHVGRGKGVKPQKGPLPKPQKSPPFKENLDPLRNK